MTWQPPDTGLGRLVEELPDAQREVVLLRFALDFQLDEIAEAQGVPLGTVKSRLHHGLKALRGRLSVATEGSAKKKSAGH